MHRRASGLIAGVAATLAMMMIPESGAVAAPSDVQGEGTGGQSTTSLDYAGAEQRLGVVGSASRETRPQGVTWPDQRGQWNPMIRVVEDGSEVRKPTCLGKSNYRPRLTASAVSVFAANERDIRGYDIVAEDLGNAWKVNMIVHTRQTQEEESLGKQPYNGLLKVSTRCVQTF